MSNTDRKPQTVRVQLVKNGACVAEKCILAASFWSRARGLIGKKALNEGEGLWLKPCNDIHMWFMKIPIDVIFVRVECLEGGKKAFRVTSTRENLRPWRLLPTRDGKAHNTIELPVGTIRRCDVRAGDELICTS